MSYKPNPAFAVKASDWEIASIRQIGGADITGAGIWFFKIRSKYVGIDEPFNYVGVLGGYGGSIGGASLPSPTSPRQMSYSRIQCLQRFSLDDLDGSFGRITNMSASVIAGYSLLCVSAYTFSGSLFVSQWCNGFGAGFGAIGVTSMGTWTHMDPARAAAQAQAVTGVPMGGLK